MPPLRARPTGARRNAVPARSRSSQNASPRRRSLERNLVALSIAAQAEVALAGGGAGEQQGALPGVLRHRRRALELAAGLGGAAELREEVAAHARQQVVAVERRLGGQLV